MGLDQNIRLFRNRQDYGAYEDLNEEYEFELSRIMLQYNDDDITYDKQSDLIAHLDQLTNDKQSKLVVDHWYGRNFHALHH